jgi:hypothetical protein
MPFTKKKADKKKIDEKIKFINYIDEYFNILNNDKSTDINYYARYYLLGLIKDNTIDNTNNTMEILINYKIQLNKELIAIKNDIFSYYVTVIVFYVLFFILIIIFNFEYIINTISELLDYINVKNKMISLPRYNITRSKEGENVILDEEDLNWIREHFKEDFDLWNKLHNQPELFLRVI